MDLPENSHVSHGLRLATPQMTDTMPSLKLVSRMSGLPLLTVTGIGQTIDKDDATRTNTALPTAARVAAFSLGSRLSEDSSSEAKDTRYACYPVAATC